MASLMASPVRVAATNFVAMSGVDGVMRALDRLTDENDAVYTRRISPRSMYCVRTPTPAGSSRWSDKRTRFLPMPCVGTGEIVVLAQGKC